MQRSYLITMCLLILHQIDAAYWQEWQLFQLPGGIQGFLLFNIAVLPVLLLGYEKVVCRHPKAILYAYFCASLGLLTFAIHVIFLALGKEQFTLPLSLAIIAGCLISALWQIYGLTQNHDKNSKSTEVLK